MTFQEAKTLFIDKLSSVYPQNEIRSFFFLWVNHFLKISQFELSQQKQEILPEVLETKLNSVITRLQQQEPIQYILGETVFFDLPIKVSPEVLIPRPETEELVQLIIDENKNIRRLKILDIGTGSGCIAIALAKHLNGEVFAMDFKQEILDIAQQNAKTNNVEINFMLADILEDNILLQENYDIIVSNPPYVLESEKKLMDNNVLRFEPPQALFVQNEDPLLFYTTIAQRAKQWLIDCGKLYFEINENKFDEIYDELKNLGFRYVVLVKDINDKFRFIRGAYEK